MGRKLLWDLMGTDVRICFMCCRKAAYNTSSCLPLPPNHCPVNEGKDRNIFECAQLNGSGDKNQHRHTRITNDQEIFNQHLSEIYIFWLV